MIKIFNQQIIFNVTRRIKKNSDFLIIGFILFITILITTNHNFQKDEFINNQKNLVNNIFFQKTLKTIFSNLDQKYKTIKHKIKSGENFEQILNSYSVDIDEILKIKKKLVEKVNLNKLSTNQTIEFVIDQSNNKVIKFIFPLSKTKKIYLNRSSNDKLEREVIVTKLDKKILYVEDIIEQSLYSAAINNNVPARLVIDFASIYGFQEDFQRDIKKKDEFQIVFDVFINDKNQIIETGNIIFSNLKLSGQDNSLYYFKDKEGEEGHYNKVGQSVKKALMKTPINGARLSSSFGMRKHPILGYNKMHKGTDFAAPSGTPIMASGSGTITRARWCGGGGNCIKIKHNSTYETIYAHMKAFAKGIREGKKVKQGQIIGYVGSTGLSTGPHLHYEVLINGKKVNSQKLKLPSGKILRGEERKKFEIDRIKIDLRLANLR